MGELNTIWLGGAKGTYKKGSESNHHFSEVLCSTWPARVGWIIRCSSTKASKSPSIEFGACQPTKRTKICKRDLVVDSGHPYIWPTLLNDHVSICRWASLVAQTVKNMPAMQETWVWSLGWEDPLQKGMTTHSSSLACRIPMDRGTWQATVYSP